MYSFVWAAFFVGAGATIVIDIWIYALHRAFGSPMTNWSLAGRWFWNLPTGRIFHEDIGRAAPYKHELAVGWSCHYAIGIIYAGIFMLAMPGWLAEPTLFPAWIFGMITILPGWFLLQPGMGIGWAACKRPNSSQMRCLNILSHSVFAIGLYGMALLIR